MAVKCQSAPDPSAWFMEYRVSDLIQCMLKELLELPTPATSY